MRAPLRAAARGRIDWQRQLHFTFDGRALTGLQGDTLASALLANGVHLVARSFKYHRPRGIMAAGADDPNALVSIRRDDARYTPNLCATQVELYEGLEAYSQNRWPSLSLDVGALADLLSPLIPAGFYYKTFMWPRSAWKWLYEPRIRAAAGLGRAPSASDPDRYSNRFAHCDVLVIGAGSAGLAAAAAAADSGARIILCDAQSELGGSLLSDPRRDSWLDERLDALKKNPLVTLLPRTTAFGYFAHNLVGLNERLTDHLATPHPDQPRERQWQVRAREVVLATGAIERPLVFPGNDRPGVMLAGAARTYLNRYAAIAGSRIVVVTGSDEAYRTALDLHAAGVQVACIADLRDRAEGPWAEAARRAGLTLLERMAVVGTRGRLRIKAVQLARMDTHGQPIRGTQQTIGCDLLLVSAGFTPSVHLFSQARGKLTWDASIHAFIPAQASERVRAVGACRGVFDLSSALSEATAAGEAAAHDARTLRVAYRRPVERSAGGAADACSAEPPADLRSEDCPEALAHPGRDTRAKAFVDWQNDVTIRDLALAVREGFHSIEHVKRYTTLGMATDQGKTSNLNALAIVARALGKSVPQIGFTTFRMPYTPVTFGSFAGASRGELFDPIRTTPLHAWAANQGAVFENVAQWKRARYFPRGNEDMQAAVLRECLAVRSSCGLFDASTLGKIEVVGKDAVTFLNRMYVNSWDNLGVGRCRYGLLLREDGFILDDGVIARTADERFHVTTTTGNAAQVLALMEDYLQTEWRDLSVWLTSTTEQWAVIAIQGPHSRQVLEGLVEGIDISASAMPHMSAQRGRICGVPMLLFRVSFTGELGYEINIPADFSAPVWEQIYAAGHAIGITAYGTEAMHVLRAEKGYLIVGQDTDGTVTPEDAGLAWAIGKNKPDFVGKRSLTRSAMTSPLRKQLVGLLTTNGAVMPEEGAQIVQSREERPPARAIGHVTSAYHSAALGRSIALGLVSGGQARQDETLYILGSEENLPVRVTSRVFYDPQGARMHA